MAKEDTKKSTTISATIVIEAIRKLGLATSLKPGFLQKTAQYFADDDEA